MSPSNENYPRVLIVAEHASARFGGEAILPLHYFQFLRRMGCEVWMVVHERTRAELTEILGEDIARVSFVPDTWFHKLMFRIGKPLPNRLSNATTGLLSRYTSQLVARKNVRKLVKNHKIDVVHQPIPVSPREPSLMFDLGAPVIMGPMNGGMTYPPAFRSMESRVTRALVTAGRFLSDSVNRMFPGKLRAKLLLVSNERTRKSLPKGFQGKVIELVENGVDLSLWKPAVRNPGTAGKSRFVFVGRLIELKALDIAIEALARAVQRSQLELSLDVLGDGECRHNWENLAARMGVSDRIRFLGWKSQNECVQWLQESNALILPSVCECGGAVVLEAMAMELPVIATKWGGPADYLDSSCGILVEPTSRESMIEGFAAGMELLARSPELRFTIGQSGRRKVDAEYDWAKKSEVIVSYYRSLQSQHSTSKTLQTSGGGQTL